MLHKTLRCVTVRGMSLSHISTFIAFHSIELYTYLCVAPVRPHYIIRILVKEGQDSSRSISPCLNQDPFLQTCGITGWPNEKHRLHSLQEAARSRGPEAMRCGQPTGELTAVASNLIHRKRRESNTSFPGCAKEAGRCRVEKPKKTGDLWAIFLENFCHVVEGAQ